MKRLFFEYTVKTNTCILFRFSKRGFGYQQNATFVYLEMVVIKRLERAALASEARTHSKNNNEACAQIR